MAPEFPYLAAGIVAVITGVRREGKFPDNGIKAIIATAILVLIASASARTQLAPLVRALGIALLISAFFGLGRTLDSKKGKTND